MSGRIKVKINHHPVGYQGIALILNVILVFMVPFFIAGSVAIYIAYIVFVIVSFGIAEFLSAINGFLYADNERLHFRYVKYEEDIFYNDIAEISYGTYTEYAGRYSKMRIVLKIKTADGEEHTFNDKIDTKEMAAAFDINSKSNVPIIRMYGFLAERMPWKAKGFVEEESSFGMT